MSRSIEVEDPIITERNARFFVHLFTALEATGATYTERSRELIERYLIPELGRDVVALFQSVLANMKQAEMGTCICRSIIGQDATRHFRECPKRIATYASEKRGKNIILVAAFCPCCGQKVKRAKVQPAMKTTAAPTPRRSRQSPTQ